MTFGVPGSDVSGFDVQGAWTRQSVSVGGSPPFETQRVYWLQAGTCYADLRVPFHPGAATSCFSGRSGWDGGRYRWTHHLDLVDTGAIDLGELSWDGDRLIERGRLGGDDDLAYEEVWMRLPDDSLPDDSLPDDGGESEALETPGGCHVRVGGHALTIVDRRGAGGSFGACYRVRVGDGWESRAVIGTGAPMPVLVADHGDHRGPTQ